MKTIHENIKIRKHEVHRTRSNCVELEQTRKQSRKAYELRGMVEVGRTRSNFDTQNALRNNSNEIREKILNKRKRRQRREARGQVGQVGQLQTCEKPMKQGSRPTRPTRPTFFDALLGRGKPNWTW